MDFTREPIIETIITPKDGCKLVVRSSKSSSQEEYFVDAVEVVAFGNAFFFRSIERPKSFLVPVTDYEILEVREARMVLKNVSPDRSIKIGGGRESNNARHQHRETEKVESPVAQVSAEENAQPETVENGQPAVENGAENRSDIKLDKKRDRRRHYRKRKGGREEGKEESGELSIVPLEDDKIDLPAPEKEMQEGEHITVSTPTLLSSLLQPPPTLISETINRYRENALFKSAFFLTEEEQYTPHNKVHELLNEDDEDYTPALQSPTYDEECQDEESSTQELPSAGGEVASSEEVSAEPVHALHKEHQESVNSIDPVQISFKPETIETPIDQPCLDQPQESCLKEPVQHSEEFSFVDTIEESKPVDHTTESTELSEEVLPVESIFTEDFFVEEHSMEEQPIEYHSVEEYAEEPVSEEPTVFEEQPAAEQSIEEPQMDVQTTEETALPLFAEEENHSLEEEPVVVKPKREPKEKKQEEEHS